MYDCPVCQSGDNVSYLKKHYNYDLLFCSDCCLQFSFPMEEPGKSYYENSDLYRSRDTGLSIARYNWKFQTFFKLCHHNTHRTILDIGCGDGGFLSLSLDRGFNVFGLEFDERAVRLAKEVRKLDNIECGNWECLKEMGWKDFDIITLFDVLEHVSSPVSLIQTVFELLRPGGIVCITVPRLDRFPRIFDPVTDFPPHHFTLWSSNALIKLLSGAGFSNIDLIEKPLSANDCLIHLKWRIMRFIGGFKGDINNNNRESLSESNNKKIKKMTRYMKLGMLFFLTGINWIIKILHLGRGHSILAIVERCDRVRN